MINLKIVVTIIYPRVHLNIYSFVEVGFKWQNSILQTTFICVLNFSVIVLEYVNQTHIVVLVSSFDRINQLCHTLNEVIFNIECMKKQTNSAVHFVYAVSNCMEYVTLGLTTNLLEK